MHYKMRITNYHIKKSFVVFTSYDERVLKFSVENAYYLDNLNDYISKKEFIDNLVGLKFINISYIKYYGQIVFYLNFKNNVSYKLVVNTTDKMKIVDYINNANYTIYQKLV